VFVAAGHGVWGICLAPGTGLVVADMVVGGNPGKGNGWDVTKLAP
jgi:glycine/D-amino acid oxidase-like deaminating enzyme